MNTKIVGTWGQNSFVSRVCAATESASLEKPKIVIKELQPSSFCKARVEKVSRFVIPRDVGLLAWGKFFHDPKSVTAKTTIVTVKLTMASIVPANRAPNKVATTALLEPKVLALVLPVYKRVKLTTDGVFAEINDCHKKKFVINAITIAVEK